MKLQSLDGCTAATYIAYAFSEVATIYPITPIAGMGEVADKWSMSGLKNLMGNTLQVRARSLKIEDRRGGDFGADFAS